VESQELRGVGFTARAPSGWDVERAPLTVLAGNPDGPESVGVAVFRLAKPFRPELWDEAVGEDDGDVEACGGLTRSFRTR
jgi:hypothetical protein